MALNVLVVDDSMVMRAMIIRTLHLSGLPLGEIHQAANGQEGLRVLEAEPVDLALVDINMPVMTGEEMINRVRENPKIADLHMLVVSTEGSDTRIEFFRDKGAGFVHKPFTPETLRHAILEMTGACDESGSGESAVSGGGPDF